MAELHIKKKSEILDQLHTKYFNEISELIAATILRYNGIFELRLSSKNNSCLIIPLEIKEKVERSIRNRFSENGNGWTIKFSVGDDKEVIVAIS